MDCCTVHLQYRMAFYLCYFTIIYYLTIVYNIWMINNII